MDRDTPDTLAQDIVESPAVPPGGGPLGPGLHVGRIRVVPKSGPSLPLYLSRDNHIGIITNKNEALHVQFLQSKEPHEIDIVVRLPSLVPAESVCLPLYLCLHSNLTIISIIPIQGGFTVMG